jgi:hypothetical protein
MSIPDIPTPAPRIPNGAWAGLLDQPHPRLLGPKGFLQERVRRDPALYESLKNSELILARGIAHAVEGISEGEIQQWIAKAMKELERGVTNVHQDTWIWLTNVALTFDLFYDHISPDDRQRMIEWINPHLAAFTDDESAFHNSTPSKALCYLRIAYATWGDNPMAAAFRDHALGKLYEQRMLPTLQEFGAGGGWTECGWYQRHSVWHGAEALELARRVEGYDGFAMAPRFWYQRLAYEMFVTCPRLRPDGTEEFALEGDGSDRYWQGDDSPRLLAYLLSDYFRGSELARYTMNRRNRATAPGARILEFLYRPDLDQEPLPMETLPKAHLASGTGKVYARSDWSPDATWFRFECGDYWCAHQHYEAGNFEVFRHETLASESGEYYDFLSNHDVNWLIRTIAHNCVLVHLPGETWSRMRDGGRNAYHNDGGQTKKWDWPTPDLATWRSRRETFHRGDIVAFDDRPTHLYLAADCTPAYVPEKLEQWIRQIIFLRPHTFVIFDRVVSAKPEYRKTWLLHSRFEPQCGGDRITIVNGKGRLITQRLIPIQAEVTPIHGYTYDGATFEPNGNRLADTACKWRVEVTPAAPSKEDLFLHVLTTDEPVPATLLTDGLGLRLGDTEVRFTGDVGGTLRIGEKAFALERVVRPTKYG